MSLPTRARPSTAGFTQSMPPAPTTSPAATHRSVRFVCRTFSCHQALETFLKSLCDFAAKCDNYQAYQASPLSSQRLPSKATPAAAASASTTRTTATTASDSPFPSSRAAYTGIRHLLNASDINTDDYPDLSWRPSQSGSLQSASIEHLFAGTGGGIGSNVESGPEG
jgi:hypothetical protein